MALSLDDAVPRECLTILHVRTVSASPLSVYPTRVFSPRSDTGTSELRIGVSE